MPLSYWCGEGDGGGENVHLFTRALKGAWIKQWSFAIRVWIRMTPPPVVVKYQMFAFFRDHSLGFFRFKFVVT